MKFSLASVKFSTSKEIALSSIDWHTIKNDKEKNKHFNTLLHDLRGDSPNYTSFNNAIMQAGLATATKLKYKRKG